MPRLRLTVLLMMVIQQPPEQISMTLLDRQVTHNRWRWLGIVILLGILLSAFLLSMGLGSISIPLSEVLTIVIGGEPSKASWKDILWQFRFPKALTALCAGAALAMSGLQLQTLFRNPLAGPSILGVNAGASLGVALVVLTVGATASPANLGNLSFLSDIGVVMAASLGSAATLGIMLLVAQKVRNNMALLVFG
ncbi:MAG: iron chelate uptake ABC transporter family permease subunit, partial [Cyanobacteria bacterium P01_F01_bin.53]